MFSVFLIFQSCSKLDTKVYDQVIYFWKTQDQIAAGVAPAYSGLREFTNPFVSFVLHEVTTDEIIMPARAGNWYDGGIWEALWKHTWDANHPQFSGGWQFIYKGIARINSILKVLGEMSPSPAEILSIEAELKTVRAFYYYQAIDLYGNVPIIEGSETDCAILGNKKRAEVFAYIEKELKNSIPALTGAVNPKTYGRATKWLAQTLLAKLYLNAEVFT